MPLFARAPNSPPTYLMPSHAALPAWNYEIAVQIDPRIPLRDRSVRVGPGRARADLIQILAPRRPSAIVLPRARQVVGRRETRGAQFFHSGAFADLVEVVGHDVLRSSRAAGVQRRRSGR